MATQSSAKTNEVADRGRKPKRQLEHHHLKLRTIADVTASYPPWRLIRPHAEGHAVPLKSCESLSLDASD